jgi:hypothetical protein
MPADSLVGADLVLCWTLQRPPVNDNFYTLVAVVRGPHLGPMEDEMRALIASVHMEKPAVPQPS